MTTEQTAQVAAIRDRFFVMATSTEPADRPRAEAAARRMAEIEGVKVGRVVWVASPQDGGVAWREQWKSLRASLWESLWKSLEASLEASLWEFLEASIWTSLGDSLWRSPPDSLRALLAISVSASLRDSAWTAFYAAGSEVFGVEYAPDAAEKLALHVEITSACFALWLVPGTVILCERPATVEIVDGRLVGLTWREMA